MNLERCALAVPLALVITVFMVGPAVASGATGQTQGAATHIIVFKEGADSDAVALGLAEEYSLAVTQVYRHALSGMAAVVPPGRLNRIEADNRVAFVETNSSDSPGGAAGADRRSAHLRRRESQDTHRPRNPG